MKRHIVFAVFVLLFGTGQIVMAQSGTVGPYCDSQGYWDTDWGFPDPCGLPDPCGVTLTKFDGSLGDLSKVTITLTGAIRGSAAAENLSDQSGTTTTLKLNAELIVSRPGGGALAIASPLADETDVLDIFDGTVDYAGLSGVSYPDLDACDVVIEVLNAPFSAADLALFVGTAGEALWLPCTAEGLSRATGGGNLVTQFSTEALATVCVEYAYVPEPATMSLLGLGALGLVRRKRKRA